MPTRSRTWTRKTFRKVSGWLVYQYRVARRTVITIEGVRLRVGRHMSRRVVRALSKGGYERAELRLLNALLSPSDIVLEIGAGLGLVSAYCAKRIGSDRVYACEADPDLEPCIRETHQLNGVEPTLEMCAVGPHAGRVTLLRNKHLVSTSVVRRRVGVQPVEVPGKALNYLVGKIRPTLLIVGAEGARQELFDGADLPSVTRVVLELHDLVIGPAGTDRIREQLSGIGFEVEQRLSSYEHLVLMKRSRPEPEPERTARRPKSQNATASLR
ncbi:MAG TPA: FkbM family methyltransferase [Gemmatimonadales bacterium]|nr:FkbM family methyltransferase [Gemmatimonadales bacterium]